MDNIYTEQTLSHLGLVQTQIREVAVYGVAVLKVGFAWEPVGMQVLGPHPRPSSPRTLCVEPRRMCFHKPLGVILMPPNFDNC